MKRFGNRLLTLAAPFLVLVAVLGFFQREGTDRFQSLPALLTGIGLIISGAWERRTRRKKLLLAIRNPNDGVNSIK